MFTFIIQWNCLSPTQYFVIRSIICSFSPAYLALQKMHLQPEDAVSLKRNNIHRKMINGLVAILVAHHLPTLTIALHINLQVISVCLSIGLYFMLCSIYLLPEENIDEVDLTSLINYLSTPCLLLGSFNRHHKYEVVMIIFVARPLKKCYVTTISAFLIQKLTLSCTYCN